MQTFELIITKNNISTDEWRQLTLAIAKHTKGIRPFTILVTFNENLVRYFLISKHDLSQLSSGIEGMTITKIDEKDSKVADKPISNSKIRFVKIPTGGNLLDLKERYKVQESLDLQKVYIDIQRLGGDRIISKVHYYFKIGELWKASHQQLTIFPAHLLTMDFEKNSNYLKKTAPKYLNLEKTMHLLLSDNMNAIFSVDAFPYFSHDYYLNLTSYEFDKHFFIIGASGSGKSKLINLFIDRLAKTELSFQYRIVVIDPHASLADDLSSIRNTRVINFSGESAQLFPDTAADISAATELTTTLIKSLLGEQYNPNLERVLRFSLYVLFVAQSMSLEMLKEFLTNLDTRNQILEHVRDYIPQNIVQFFGADFSDIKTQHYNDGILPILSLVDEMQMQPALVGDAEISLGQLIQENFLTVFSLNKVSMGEKVVKTIAGLLIQQIFLLAQSRAFGQKVILIIDEISVVQNPALSAILAEARKFNLTVILTQQYIGQIEKDLRDAILSNVFNYYVFKISEEDARALEGNLNIEIPTEVMLSAKEKGIKESEIRAKIMVELDPRECLVRVSANGQLLPCIRARTVDIESHSQSNTNSQTAHELQKMPPKFNKESAAVPLLSMEQPKTVEVEKKEEVPEDPKIEEEGFNYGISLSEILATQSSSRPKDNKQGGLA